MSFPIESTKYPALDELLEKFRRERERNMANEKKLKARIAYLESISSSEEAANLVRSLHDGRLKSHALIERLSATLDETRDELVRTKSEWHEAKAESDLLKNVIPAGAETWDKESLKNLTIIARPAVATCVDFGAWEQRQLADFGSKIAPYLRAAWILAELHLEMLDVSGELRRLVGGEDQPQHGRASS